MTTTMSSTARAPCLLLSALSDPALDVDETQEKMSIELVVLDQIHVEVKKDLIRQLMEIYNLAVSADSPPHPVSAPALTASSAALSASGTAPSDAPALTVSPAYSAASTRSHFQYILENSTEANIHYVQPGTLDVRMLAPGQRVPFSFANPYLPKMLEFALEVRVSAPSPTQLLC